MGKILQDLKYHSALFEVTTARPVRRWEKGGNIALVHNVTQNLPREMDRCDVIYSDPPWQQGYDIFNQRAGIKTSLPYSTFIRILGTAIEASRKPAVLVLHMGAVKHLPSPTRVRHVIFSPHKCQAIAAEYGETGVTADNTNDILAQLAERYQCVGDPCCGYGWTARAFAAAGKRFVCSDISAEAIGYLASKAEDWL